MATIIINANPDMTADIDIGEMDKVEAIKIMRDAVVFLSLQLDAERIEREDKARMN